MNNNYIVTQNQQITNTKYIESLGNVLSYQAIPQELKDLNQWCLTIGDSKSPRTWDNHTKAIKLASVTDPTTWLSFNDALFIVNHYREQGQDSFIGFVFTAQDAFGCIDLDNKQSLPERIPEFHKLIAQADSYTEVSKSGTGYHVIVKGNIGKGRRFDTKGIEIYSQERFIIFTADVYLAKDIINGEEILAKLMAHMKPVVTTVDSEQLQAFDKPSQEADEDLLNRIAGYNDPVFKKLYAGNWEDYKSRSEADFALVNKLLFYTQDVAQVTRLFKKSGLHLLPDEKTGKPREAVKTGDYVGRSITRAIHEQLIQKQREKEQMKEAISPDFLDKLRAMTEMHPVNNSDYCLEKLPYELGILQNYFFTNAIYPDMEIAGLSAIALLQAYLMPKHIIDSYGALGFNENHLIMAVSTFGKEDYIRSFDRLANTSIGEPKFTSQRALPASKQGMHRQLEDNPSQHYLVDEFGEYLATTRNNSLRQEVIGHMMESYNRFGILTIPNTKDGDYEPVINPKVGMLAFTTHSRALETMTESHSDSGTYNRYIIHSSTSTPIKTSRRDWNPQPIAESTLKLLKKCNDAEKDTMFTLSTECDDLLDSYDALYFEPLKAINFCFAGRLQAQMLKMAGAIAFSNGRLQIETFDIELATAIRLGLYYGFKRKLDFNGGIGVKSESEKVLAQLRNKFNGMKSGEYLYIAHLTNWSVGYKGLSVNIQHSVRQALIAEGTCYAEGKRLVKF